MPRYAVWAVDHPGRLADRERVREAHRARLRAPAPHQVVVQLAGPLLGGPDGAMDGTLLVVDAPDMAAVRRFVADDPYSLAGVYATVDIRRWRCGLGPLAEPPPGDET